jgi:hypothetical protein
MKNLSSKLGMLIILVPVIMFAGTILKTINFSEHDLNIQKIGEYSLVRLNGLTSYQEIGAPIVPAALYNILIPADAEVTGIQVVSQREQTIAGEFYLYPGQMPKPITTDNIDNTFIEPDQSIYSSSQVYPVKVVDYSSTGNKSGYRICSYAVFPVRYIPAEQKLSLITDLTLEFTYENNKVTVQPITEKQKEVFSQDVKNIICNPEDVERFSPSINMNDENEIDCVIITSEALGSSFQPLVDWHNKKGFRTEVKGTSWISSTYSGRDLPERMRNFIIDYFNNRGLKWVILAGDYTLVPPRRARSVVGSYTGNIPSDLYFSDLQWSWDGNNNSVFGESNGDTVDFFADLYVGRASVDNATEINTFITKIFTYEKNPDTSYLKKILLPASELWTNYNHMLSQDSIAHMSPAGWYDCEINQGTNTSLRYQVRDSLNAGFGLAHLVGHGDDQGVYISSTPMYYVSDPATQTNYNKLIACYPGNFEYSDCLAEQMMKAQGSAVAVMMCSRYGWGTPPSIGPSELLDVAFYDLFFNYDSSYIGSCFSTSKDAYRYYAESQQVWRWCVYELNLFGDPVMPMWNDVPSPVNLTMPDSVQTGPRSLRITVTRSGFPVSNALVGIYKPGEVYSKGKTNTQGQIDLMVNALTPGTIYFTVTGENAYPKEDSMIVTQGSALPYIVLNNVTVTQVNPNETVNTNVIIGNTGNATASNTMGVLRTSSSYVTLMDSTSSYGTINPSTTSNGDLYTFTTAANTPPGTQIPFTLYITADQGNWTINFNITCGIAPLPGMLVADNDTGYCSLSVSSYGAIGYSSPAEKIGSGFRYPKSAISSLYFSSMMAGNSPTYVVDRFYGHPATSQNQDWQVVESLRFVTPPIYGDEHLRSSYNDAGHTTPQGLKVIQNSYSLADSRYDDFIVLTFDYQNTGTSTITGLYSGIIADFDIPPDSSNMDAAFTDATRRLVYMRRAAAQVPTVGIKLLYPLSAANLTCVDHDLYVYPDTAMTEGMKYRILNGGIHLAQSNRTYDWSVAASAGPFDLTPSQHYQVAYAFVGGNSDAMLLANADSAQVWYDRLSGIVEENDVIIPGRSRAFDFSITPNPSNNPIRIAYNLLTPGNVTVGLYDITGQFKAELFNGTVNTTSGSINLRIKDLPSGVYFVKLATGKQSMMKKFLLVK